MNTEKELTGFENTQELPLSDKDVQTIQDCLMQAQRDIYNVITANTYTLTPEIKGKLLDRAAQIDDINQKLNR